MHFGKDSISCTLEHPFFVDNKWLPAKKLKVGDKLFAFNGKKIAIDSIHSFRTDTATKVYNLEVKSNNNFYISASKVLVHNCNFSSKINLGQQAKHIIGKSYIEGRSILNIDAQTLLDGLNSGKYNVIRTYSPNKSLVDFGRNIGTYFENGVEIGPSRFGVVVSGKNGVHIYPANPIQY